MKKEGSDLKIMEEMERKKLQDRYIRFDWAIKRLLRQKANFDVLDGFLTVMLNEEIKIVEILESEGNQESADDKFNRVDIKALNSKGEIILVEIQNTRELHYLERILYGVAKAITEHISIGEGYGKIKKVYSISILYFDIGIGTDYIYHGQNHFVGVHTGDHLRVNTRERDVIVSHLPAEIFPEYILVRVNEFDKVALTPLDEWIEYLKDGTIRPDTTAPGLKEAREKLKYYSMSPQERLRPPSRRHHDPERCDRHGQIRRENRGKSRRSCRRHASSRFEDERYGCRRCYHSKVYRLKRRNSFVFVRGVHFSISHYLYAEGLVLRTEPNCLHLNYHSMTVCALAGECRY
jgi:predicted transposase/invertase (TIGR01784 family)